MPSTRALTNEAAAILAGQRDEPREALRHLHLARQLWTSVESRLHAARLRLAIAALQLKLGDRTGAAVELRAATTAAQELDSEKLREKCREMEEMLA